MSSKPKGFIATNWFRLFIVAFAVVLLLIYFERESALDNCMAQAAQSYENDWQFQCKEAKLQPNCSLSRQNASHIEGARSKRADECIKRYSFK